MRGRKPIPDTIKLAKGTLRKSRKRNTPKSSGIPKCPFNLRTIAGRKWKEVVSGLSRLGLIDEIDKTHIEAYCTAYQMAREADAVIAKEGMSYETPLGPKKHPACQVSSDAWSRVRALGNDLGLNYLSRQRMSTRTEENKDQDLEKRYLG